MHDIMVKPLPPGCRLTAIFDVSSHVRFQWATTLKHIVVCSLVTLVQPSVRSFSKYRLSYWPNCHADLPYIYSTEGKIKEPNLAAEAGSGLLSAVTSYARGDMVRVRSVVI